MKHASVLIAGYLTGALVFALLMYNNPFSVAPSISPLAVTDQRLMNLQYKAVPHQSIAFTNGGESGSPAHPGTMAELWEDTIRDTRVLVTELADIRGNPAGIGIKFSSDSEDTRLLNSAAMVDSAWHIYLPDLGTLFVDQRENYWAYLHDIVIPARLSSSDTWRGSWLGVMTTGPNAIGTGRVVGGNGLLGGIESEVVESLSATAYSSETGPVAMTGSLSISIPDDDAEPVTQSDD